MLIIVSYFRYMLLDSNGLITSTVTYMLSRQNQNSLQILFNPYKSQDV